METTTPASSNSITGDALLAEYESQLAEVNELLAGDPSNVAFLNLRSDMLELIELTRTSSDTSDVGEKTMRKADDGSDDVVITQRIKQSISEQERDNGDVTVTVTDESQFDVPLSLSKGTTGDSNNKKETAAKATVAARIAPAPPSTFEVPDQLIPLESDTEATKKHKRRTIKALKRKWKERVREVELGNKQSSWQDFNCKKNKKMKTKEGQSIFATEDGVMARVGVIGSGRTMTEYSKRAKHA